MYYVQFLRFFAVILYYKLVIYRVRATLVFCELDFLIPSFKESITQKHIYNQSEELEEVFKIGLQRLLTNFPKLTVLIILQVVKEFF